MRTSVERISIFIVASLLAVPIALCVSDILEIRGEIATGSFTWTSQNFAGFYYDIDDDVGTETVTTTVIDGNKLSGSAPYGIRYTTTAQKRPFEFGDWGYYNVVGFMAKKYFAGYVRDSKISPENQVLYSKSTDADVLSEGQLIEILVDDDAEMTVMEGTPLILRDGYELHINSVYTNDGRVSLELFKDGYSVDAKELSVPKGGKYTSCSTYYYKKDVGNANGIIIIAVHFKNAYKDEDGELVTVDGEWQISDEHVDIMKDAEYDKMTITSYAADTITMENVNNTIDLEKNGDISLMPRLGIRTIGNDSLKYYIYMDIAEPGTYEVRGAVAAGNYTWNPQNFAGFYCDFEGDIGTESITANLTDGNKLSGDEPYGLKYTTASQKCSFKFGDWGYYNALGLFSLKCFAGYVEDTGITGGDDVLYQESTDKNPFAKGKILLILMDENKEWTLEKGKSLRLKDGYELHIRGVNAEQAYVELTKDGRSIDSKVISPSIDSATAADKTYCYRPSVGDLKDIVILAVHFKDIVPRSGHHIAVIDGEWQLLDTPVDVVIGSKYGKVTVTSSTPTTIVMENKNEQIVLGQNKDLSFMPAFGLKVADNDTLRYYLYSLADIGGVSGQ